jgi:hypothetical protein
MKFTNTPIGAPGQNTLYGFARTGWIQTAANYFPYPPVLAIDAADRMEMQLAYQTGQWFNDPRSMVGGHSPVYWYSIQIWRAQQYGIPVGWLNRTLN